MRWRATSPKSAVLKMHEAIELKQVPGGQAELTPLKPYLHSLVATMSQKPSFTKSTQMPQGC
jgi:hypothetical protein